MDDVLIVGSLDKKALEKSINDLVNFVDNKTGAMANSFVGSMTKMENAMKNFATTQRVSVSSMQDAWKDMRSSLDAMVEKESSVGSSSGNKSFGANTIGSLEQEINLLKAKRRELELNSDELRKANAILEERKRLLNEQKTSPNALSKKAIQEDLAWAKKLPANELSQIQRKLQEIRAIQTQMSTSGLFKRSEIQAVNNEIASLEKKIREMRNLKPTSLNDVLNMSANSFEEISRKMSALKKVTWANDVEKQKVISAYKQLREEQNKLLSTNSQMVRSNNYLAQSFGYIRNRVVYALTLGAASAFVKNIYEIRGQYEMLERSLGVLLNSFERGTQIFQELNTMALKSPFTLMDLAGAAKQLSAYNFTANEVVGTTRRLADISAALGVPMERLTYNLGQIRAQTVLNARDARDFANAGLAIVPMLSKYYSELEGRVVSVGDVYDRMSKKMVAYKDVMAVINQATDEGGKFFDFQAKQAETLKVQMNNLTLALNNMFNEIGQSNQYILTLPVKGLKTLLSHWKDINSAIIDVVIALGLLKVAQIIAIRNGLAWGAMAGSTARQMGTLANAIKGVAASTKALFLNPWTWVFVGIAAITDMTQSWIENRKELAKFNEEIRKAADEASQSNLDYLNNSGNINTRKLARQGKLTDDSGQKAWSSIKEQIRQASDNADVLLARLAKIPDINERIVTSFNYIESLQKVQGALQDIKDDTIVISQDNWRGIFGEGLVSDLKDYKDAIDGLIKISKSNAFGIKFSLDAPQIKQKRAEFEHELDKTADSINNFINAHSIKDPLQIEEILERVKVQIKTKYPEIQGELANLLDVSLDQKMAEKTKGAVDKSSSLWKMFTERLKNNYSSAFQGISDDFLDKSNKLTAKQQKAVDDNLKYFKDTMPYFYDAVANMVKDASQLKIKIGIAFNLHELTDFQKELKGRLKKQPMVYDVSEALMPNDNEDLISWTKRMQDVIKKAKDDNKKYSRDKSKWSQEHIKDNNKEISQAEHLLDVMHQQYAEEKKRTGNRGGSKKDILGDAVSKEVQLINEARRKFNDRLADGESYEMALNNTSKEYNKTLATQYALLRKFGVKDLLPLKNIMAMDDKGIARYFEKQISGASKSAKAIEALEKAMLSLNQSGEKELFGNITKNLNQELSNLKDSYELAVSIDAEPEIGNTFAKAMGIDTNALPHTIKEYANEYTRLLNKYLSDKKQGLQLQTINLADYQLLDLKEKADNKALSKEAYDFIAKGVKEYRSLERKEIEKSIKEYDKLLEKYATYEHKRTKIAKDANKERVDLINRLGSEEQKDNAAKLSVALETETDPEKKEQLKNQLQDLVDDIARSNVKAVPIAIAIDRKEEQEQNTLDFEEYKKGTDWIAAFNNAANLSDETLKRIYGDLSAIVEKKHDLDPTQIKEINDALEKMRNTMVDRNPFATLAKSLSNIKKAKTEVEAAQQDVEAANNEKNQAKNAFEYEKALQHLNKANERLKNAQNSYNQAVRDAGNVMQKAISASQAMFDSMTNIKGILGDTANEAIQAGFSIASGMSAAWAAIKEGEKSTAILAIIQMALQAINFIAGLLGQKKGAYDDLKGQAETLTSVIDKVSETQKKALDKSVGVAALKKYEELKKYNDMAIESYRDVAKAAGDAGKSAGSRSYAYRTNRALADSWGKLSKIAGKSIRTVQDMYSLAPEELKKIMELAAPEWSRIEEDIRDAFEKMIEYGDKAQEYKEALTKAYTKVSLDDVTDNFESMLADMDNDAEKFADNFGEYLKNAIVRSMVYKTYSEELANWYKSFSNAMSDANLDETEVTNLREEYMGIVNRALQERGELTKVLGDLGSNKNLSALQQGISSVTEETASAVESYLNSMSQQSYLRNTLITQIIDTLQGMGFDIQTSVMSQMLLQLQNSYQTQQAIRNLLDGWNNASGSAVRVELIS